MEYENRTPHAVGLLREDGTISVLEPVQPPVRIAERMNREVAREDGIVIHDPSTFEGVEHLPRKQDGRMVVVSRLAALLIGALHPDRTDVVYPATSQKHGARRDKRGPIAVRRLIRAA